MPGRARARHLAALILSNNANWKTKVRKADDLIKDLAECLRECSDDLHAEILARFGEPIQTGCDIPRRIKRDLEPVLKARRLLAEVNER